VPRKRISLTMKMDAAPARREGRDGASRDNRYQPAGRDQRARGPHGGGGASQNTAMASAFAKLQDLKK
jgi:uncharacterized protein